MLSCWHWQWMLKKIIYGNVLRKNYVHIVYSARHLYACWVYDMYLYSVHICFSFKIFSHSIALDNWDYLCLLFFHIFLLIIKVSLLGQGVVGGPISRELFEREIWSSGLKGTGFYFCSNFVHSKVLCDPKLSLLNVWFIVYPYGHRILVLYEQSE